MKRNRDHDSVSLQYRINPLYSLFSDCCGRPTVGTRPRREANARVIRLTMRPTPNYNPTSTTTSMQNTSIAHQARTSAKTPSRPSGVATATPRRVLRRAATPQSIAKCRQDGHVPWQASQRAPGFLVAPPVPPHQASQSQLKLNGIHTVMLAWCMIEPSKMDAPPKL